MRSAAAGRGPFVVGLLNGLMPCGPLQTMQVYALGTGSFMAGALSMFLFSLGTVPLLLGFGAVSAFLSARFNRGMLKASGVLVMALGLVMFMRGVNLFGVALPAIIPGAGKLHRGGKGDRRPPGREDHRGVQRLPSFHRPGGDSRPLDREREGGRPQRLQQSPDRSPVRDQEAARPRGQPDRVHPRSRRDHCLHVLDGDDHQLHQGRAGSQRRSRASDLSAPPGGADGAGVGPGVRARGARGRTQGGSQGKRRRRRSAPPGGRAAAPRRPWVSRTAGSRWTPSRLHGGRPRDRLPMSSWMRRDTRPRSSS